MPAPRAPSHAASTRAGSALLALLLAGCPAPIAPITPSAPIAPEAGTLRVWVRDRVGWPLHLADVSLAVDGRPLLGAVSSASPASPSISAGLHTLVARARLRGPCALGAEQASASMTAAFTLRVGQGGADLEAEVVTRGSPAMAPEARPELRMRASGDASVTAWNSGAAYEAQAANAACAPVVEPEAAVCRVRLAVAGAKARRDVVDYLCKQDKLSQLEAYAKLLKESLERAPHGPFEEARERVARRRMAELEVEAWQCLGEELAFLPQVVIERACAGELPEPWKD